MYYGHLRHFVKSFFWLVHPHLGKIIFFVNWMKVKPGYYIFEILHECANISYSVLQIPKSISPLYNWSCWIIIILTIINLHFKRSDVCKPYFEDNILGKDFARKMEKESVCGIVKNRDIVSQRILTKHNWIIYKI